jgi:hypothetical protein
MIPTITVSYTHSATATYTEKHHSYDCPHTGGCDNCYDDYDNSHTTTNNVQSYNCYLDLDVDNEEEAEVEKPKYMIQKNAKPLSNRKEGKIFRPPGGWGFFRS